MKRSYSIAMVYLIITGMALTAYAIGELPRCEIQPTGVNLNPSDKSDIFWVFDTPQINGEWILSGGPGNFVAGYSYGHCGDDYYANDWVRKDGKQEGQPVYAGISGIVYTRYFPNTWGKEVIIYNSDYKFALRYAHLDWCDESLNGKWISATSDTPIGKIGKTGLGTGPHLHLVLYKNVDTIDDGNPVRYSSCSVENEKCSKSATKYAAQFSFSPRPTTQSSPFTVPTIDSFSSFIQSLIDKDSEIGRKATEAIDSVQDAKAMEPLTEALNDPDSGVRRTAKEVIDNFKSQTQTEAENEFMRMLRGILENLGISLIWINRLLP